MKIKNICRLTLDALLKRAFVNLILVIVCGVSVYMSDVMLTNYLQKDYRIRYETASFATDMDRTYHIGFQKQEIGKAKEFMNFINRIRQIPDVSFAGTFSDQNIIFDEIPGRVFPGFRVDKDILPVGATGLTKEEIRKLQANADGEYIQVMAGADYKDTLQIGDTYSNTDWPGGRKFKIVGYFKKGTQWMLRTGPFYGSTVDSLVLDDKLMMIREDHTVMEMPDWYPNYIWYVTEEHADAQEINALVHRAARENNYYITINSVQSAVDEKIEELNLEDNKEFIASLLIVSLAVISISASAVIACLLRKRYYGILYASGISMREIGFMTILENIFLILIPSVFVYICRVFELNRLYPVQYRSEVISGGYFIVHNGSVLMILIGLVFFMVIVSSVFPLLMIKNMKPVELIGGEND